MKTTKAILSVVALALLFVSCEKTAEDFGPADGRIILNASNGYTNSPQTKTEYSGVDENGGVITSSSQYERIDWVADKDIVRILCAQALNPDNEPLDHADYKIGSPSAVNQRNVAGGSPVSPDQEMYWGTGDHYFYALYPAAGTKSNYHTSHTVTEAQSNIEPLTGNKAKITGSIPAEQSVVLKEGTRIYKPNMNYAYMYAAEKTARTADGVSLHFYPLVTTFEFSLRALDDAMAAADLTSLKLSSSSTYMTGGFTATIDADATTPATIDLASSGLGREITVNFPDNTRLSKTEYSVVTVLALGVAQTDLRLTLAFANNTTRSIDIKKKVDDTENLEAVSVGACKKVYFKLAVPGSVIYVLEHSGETVTLGDGTVAGIVRRNSYTSGESTTNAPFRTYKHSFGSTDEMPVDVEVYQYGTMNDDGTITWVDAKPSSLSSVTPVGTLVDRTLGAEIAEDNWEIDSYDETITSHAQHLKSKSPVSNLDLSLYEVGNLTIPRAGNKRVTANCYVIDRPGSYRFPLVYGNAIDWTKNLAAIKSEFSDASAITVDPQTTGWNVYSYSNGTDAGPFVASTFESVSYWNNFYRFDGNYIGSPYILSDLGLTVADVEAVVFWEDVLSSDYSMLGGQPTVEMDSVTGFKNSDGTDIGSMPYIHFTVPVGAVDSDLKKDPRKRVTGIREGNIQLALRTKEPVTVAEKEYPAGTIIWRWQIWISDGNLEPITVTQRTAENQPAVPTDDLLRFGIGYCNNNFFVYHAEREWYVKVKHSDTNSDAAPLVFKIVQAPAMDDAIFSSGTSFQWGRMIPFPPIYQHFQKEKGETWDWTNPSFVWDHEAQHLYKETYSPAGIDLYRAPSSDGGIRGFINGEKLHYSFLRTYVDNIKDWFQSTRLLAGSRVSSGNLSADHYSVPVDPDHQGSFQNTWNMPNKTDHGTGDFKVYKTVYDPCPPGFSVPHGYAFSFMRTSGRHYGIDINEITKLNIVDTDENGPSYSDYWHYDEAAHNMVANFYTRIGGGEMYPFLPLSAGGGYSFGSLENNQSYNPGSWLAATTTGGDNGFNMDWFGMTGFKERGSILITPMVSTSGMYLLGIIPMKEHF